MVIIVTTKWLLITRTLGSHETSF
uniref:Uncharacterized protein n=1 Tax=Rhizophora mucronata TaxID=61149 RepID=A0A2P2R0H6_RHIMU